MKNKKTKDKVVILLTATIDPRGMGLTKLTNPVTRENQYLDALEFYLNETKLKIVFCENTGTNIYNKINSAEKDSRLEYLTFQGNNYDKSKGKGYGEAKIISYALKNSKFLEDCIYIIKITGRIKVLNINDYIGTTEINEVNSSKDIWVDFFSEWYIISSVCFIIPKNILKYMIQKYENKVHDIAFCFEEMLYQSLLGYNDIVIHPSRFKLKGICAGSNQEYMNISEIKHLGTNAYIMSIIQNKRGYYFISYIEMFKYFFYRGIEIITKLFHN